LAVHPKVISAAAVIALMQILIWLFETYTHTTIPLAIRGEGETLAVFLAGYLTPGPSPSA
jgi:hypothetical protein